MKKLLFKTLLLIPILNYASDIEYDVQMGPNFDSYLIKGRGEECKVVVENKESINFTSCLSITNSKGIKILCTKKKKMCKTETEFLNFVRSSEIKKDLNEYDSELSERAQQIANAKQAWAEEMAEPAPINDYVGIYECGAGAAPKMIKIKLKSTNEYKYYMNNTLMSWGIWKDLGDGDGILLTEKSGESFDMLRIDNGKLVAMQIYPCLRKTK